MWQKIQTIHLIYFISFMDLFAIGLTFPLYSTYLRSLGASHTLVGAFSSIYSATQVLSGPIIGGWSDVRSRKSVLRITLVLCALSYAFLGLTKSLLLIFCLRFFLGFVKHTQSICKAVITDVVPLTQQEAVFGKSSALSSLGFIVGPFLGGNLSEKENGFLYVCLLTSLLFFLTYIITSFLPDSKTKSPQNGNVSIIATVRKEFSKTFKDLKEIDWSEHWDVFLLKFLSGLTMTTYFSNQSIYLKEKYHLSQKYLGYTISYFSIIGMISAFFLNKIETLLKTRNQSHYQRIFLCFSMLTVCFILIYLSPNLYILLALLIPFSFSATALRVILIEQMFSKTEKIHSGSLAGASNSIMSIARFFTPLFTGVTNDLLGEESVMLVATIPAIFALGTSFYLEKKCLSRIKVD